MSAKERNAHEKKHDHQPIPCDLCDASETFPSKALLDTHLREAHNPTYKSQFCAVENCQSKTCFLTRERYRYHLHIGHRRLVAEYGRDITEPPRYTVSKPPRGWGWRICPAKGCNQGYAKKPEMFNHLTSIKPKSKHHWSEDRATAALDEMMRTGAVHAEDPYKKSKRTIVYKASPTPATGSNSAMLTSPAPLSTDRTSLGTVPLLTNGNVRPSLLASASLSTGQSDAIAMPSLSRSVQPSTQSTGLPSDHQIALANSRPSMICSPVSSEALAMR